MQYGNTNDEKMEECNLYRLAEFFKVLGDPTRIRLLFHLMGQEVRVGELAARVGVTQSAISHQLNLLKSAKLVKQRRNGKLILYTLADKHVYMVIETGQEHIWEQKQ